MITIDRVTITQIIGCLMQNPDLLSETDKYRLEMEDFRRLSDKYIFSAIYNLYINGAGKIHTIDIMNSLKDNSSAYDLIEKENGIAFLQDSESNANLENFNYYYNKLKKINLVIDLQKAGHDTSSIYCEDLLDKDRIKINDAFERMTTTDIINHFKKEITIYEEKYSSNSIVEESYACEGLEELLKELKESPEIGATLQGEIFNTVVRGGRKGKMYLRSAGTSVGKTRNMVADAANIAYPIRYSTLEHKWIVTNPNPEKTLYIMTEQDTEEIKTMLLSFLTGISEEVFLYGSFTDNEMPRIKTAIQIMETYKDNMLFARIPDPCASIIKNLFRKYNLQYGVENFFYDYIFSSPAMLNEYRDLALREDVALRLLSTTLKNLAVELNAFVETSTQISNEEKDDGSFKDYHNIRGAKSVADVADLGCMMQRPTINELTLVNDFVKQCEHTPNLITDIYKNRRGRWTMCRIWSYINLGTLRKKDLFITSSNNKPLEDFSLMNITIDEDEELNKFVNKLNNEDETMIDFSAKEKEKSQEIIDNFEEVFGTSEAMKKQLNELEIDDLI